MSLSQMLCLLFCLGGRQGSVDSHSQPNQDSSSGWWGRGRGTSRAITLALCVLSVLHVFALFIPFWMGVPSGSEKLSPLSGSPGVSVSESRFLGSWSCCITAQGAGVGTRPSHCQDLPSRMLFSAPNLIYKDHLPSLKG